MTTKRNTLSKGPTKKVVLFSLGTLALGTLTFFGVKAYNNRKNNSDDTDDSPDETTPADLTARVKPRSNLSTTTGGNPFPLRSGSRGMEVKALQQALIQSYGKAILPRFGADGQFGSELTTALRSKGYQVPLSKEDFLHLTKKQTAPAIPLFDAAAMARSFASTIGHRDFPTSLTLLKGTRTASNYALVSEKLKSYRINGVHQTLVNALLSTFTESTQRAKLQDTLKNIGLTYNGSQWSLSGSHR